MLLNNIKSILKIKKYIKNYKKYIVLGIWGLIFSALVFLPVPYLTGYVLDNVLIGSKNYNEFFKIIIILAFLYLIKFFISINTKKSFLKVQNWIVNDIRLDILDEILEFPMKKIDNSENGYLLSRINECEGIGNLFSSIFVNNILSIIEALFSIVFMVNISYKLTFIVILILPIYFFTLKKSSNKLSESTIFMFEAQSVLSGKIFEILNGIEEIKILNVKEASLKKFKEKVKSLIITNINFGKRVILFMENTFLINDLSCLLILLFAGIMILQNSLTLGIYLAFIAYMNKLFASVSSLASINLTLQPACVAIERVFEFLETESEKEDNLQKEQLNEEIKNIKIENFDFEYENGKNIIKNLNFEINKGDKILIKGRNGSGKSTLIKSILGLYEPIRGEIYYNDKLFSNLDKKSVRKRIGVVSQNIFLFKGSVLENILYGIDNKDIKDVLEEIEKYDLADYIDTFKNGLDTMILDNGNGISGGQVQIIAFLRAVIRKKDILILDESTSNVDIETKEHLLDSIQKNNMSEIVIIISHDDINLEYVNKILNLQENVLN